MYARAANRRKSSPISRGLVLASTLGVDAWALGSTIRDATVRKYEIVHRLAAGGMGTVYLGRLRGALGFSRLVALKSMHAQYALDPNFRAMFVDEARLTALLHHPNIVPTIDVVSTDDSLMLVMEYVEGSSLYDLCQRPESPPVPLPVAVAVIHDLLSGLHHAHTATDEVGNPLGIIHRDVSPQNLLVGRDGLARVLDFGIARALRTVHASDTGAVRGKVAYMPPEQLCGKAIDHRVDIYAAGVVLWETLTGRRLFQGENLALVTSVLTGEVPPPSTVRPDIPPELDAIVLAALAKDPAMRYPTAQAMAEALRSVIPLASRAAITRWVTGEMSLSSTLIDAAFVWGEQESGITLAPTVTRSSEPPRRQRGPKVTTLAMWLAMLCTLGIVVGARHKVERVRQPRRDAVAAPAPVEEPHATTRPLPAPSTVVVPTIITLPTPSAEATLAQPPKSEHRTCGGPGCTDAPRNVAPPKPRAVPGPRPPARPHFDSSLGF